MNPQTNCRLMTLPRELRDLIYGYVFSNLQDEAIFFDEAVAKTPQIDLALTCRLLHEEAADLHQASYQAFWSRNTFLVEIRNRDGVAYKGNAITRKQMQHMTHIVLRVGWPLNLTYLHLKDSTCDDASSWDVSGDGPDDVDLGCFIKQSASVPWLRDGEKTKKNQFVMVLLLMERDLRKERILHGDFLDEEEQEEDDSDSEDESEDEGEVEDENI